MKDRFGFDGSDIQGTQFWRRPVIGRRLFFRHAASAVGGYFLLPSLTTETVARAAAPTKGTAKNCIFILMLGGPSQIDTFDLKEGSWMPSSFAPAAYGDIRWPQGLMPELAKHIGSLALVRSARAWAAVHGLAQVWVQIGRNPIAAASRIAPHIGSVASLELSAKEAGVLPAFVSINAGSGPGSGYLPPAHAPFYISPNGGGLGNTQHSFGAERFDRRYSLLVEMDNELRGGDPLGAAAAQTIAYNLAARRLVYNSDVDRVFLFDAAERNRYGNSGFGNACIAARNVLRANMGVRFVQITQGNWDQHENIYAPNAGHLLLSQQFDKGLGLLLEDLKAGGQLDETLIVAMGEFGRTTGALNPQRGRDHLLQQAVLVAGAGVRGGRVIGSTNAAGSATLEPGWSRNRDIRPEDIEATMYSALGIDWTTIRKDDPLNLGFAYVPSSDRNLYGPVHELWD